MMEPLRTGFEGITLDFFSPPKSRVQGVDTRSLVALLTRNEEPVYFPEGARLDYAGVNDVGGLRVVIAGVTYIGNGGGAIILSGTGNHSYQNLRLTYASVARIGTHSYCQNGGIGPEFVWENADVPPRKKKLK